MWRTPSRSSGELTAAGWRDSFQSSCALVAPSVRCPPGANYIPNARGNPGLVDVVSEHEISPSCPRKSVAVAVRMDASQLVDYILQQGWLHPGRRPLLPGPPPLPPPPQYLPDIWPSQAHGGFSQNLHSKALQWPQWAEGL